MKLAMVVPGGVDRSGEIRVIPALLALIERLARVHDVHVFVLRQETERGSWPLLGATVHNIGDGWTRLRAIGAIHAEHRRAPFDLVQAIFSGSCGFLAVAMAKWLRVPGVVHIGGGELVALREIGYGGRLTLRGRLREALVLRATDAVTAASTPIIDALHALGLRAQRIPLGVDLKQWPPLAPRARNGAQARLIHVASLNRVKDPCTLLYALAALAQAGVDFHMDIVGVDTLRGEIQHQAEQLGLTPRIRFLGFKTQRELRPIMAAADLLVLSSRHEAGPLVLLEAAVLGIPTVGTAVGHLAEWSPQAACAVPAGDWHGLAAAIAYVLRHDDLRLHLAGEAQRRALAEDADYTAGMFEALYRQLLASREMGSLREAR
jgi:glycosyltransferase involved in cell wall biosynthesis